MYYKLQCWLAIFRQLLHTAQHPCASLSTPAPGGDGGSSLGAPREAQGRVLAAAWHQVTQAVGSVSPGKTRVSPHPSSYLRLLLSNARARRGWRGWNGPRPWPPLAPVKCEGMVWVGLGACGCCRWLSGLLLAAWHLLARVCGSAGCTEGRGAVRRNEQVCGAEMWAVLAGRSCCL